MTPSGPCCPMVIYSRDSAQCRPGRRSMEPRPSPQWRTRSLIHSQVLWGGAGRWLPTPGSTGQTSGPQTCHELARPPKQRKTHHIESPCRKQQTVESAAFLIQKLFQIPSEVFSVPRKPRVSDSLGTLGLPDTLGTALNMPKAPVFHRRPGEQRAATEPPALSLNLHGEGPPHVHTACAEP